MSFKHLGLSACSVACSAILALGVWLLGAGPMLGFDAEMVLVEAGPFTMGTPDGPTDETPAHVLVLPAYEIDRLLVTTSDFAAFLNEVGPVNARGQSLFDVADSDARIHLTDGSYEPHPGFELHPVVEVSWYGARGYCAWRGARLPSEAEWEKAARGPDGQVYPWGDDEPNASLARYSARLNDYLPVGSLPANASPYGVLDMVGNVWQWTSSLYQPYPYRADDGREDPEAEGQRVARGGSHSTALFALRAAYRGYGYARLVDRGQHNVGFRCARSR